MKKYFDELMKRIDELIKVYEIYLWTDEENRKLIVGFQENKMLTFYLYNKDELIDEIYLAFEDKEDKFYKAICLKTFSILLGNVMAHKHIDDEGHVMYYNESLKPYLIIFSIDDEITNLIDSVIDNQENETINNSKIIKKLTREASTHIPNIGVLRQLDNRIDISKKVLRGIQ